MCTAKKAVLTIIAVVLATSCTATDSEDIEVISRAEDGYYTPAPIYIEAESEQASAYNSDYYQDYQYYQIKEIALASPAPTIFMPHELTLENVLIIASQRRQIVYEPNMERIHGWLEARAPIALDGARLFNDRRNNSLSREEAAYDIKVLFELLRHIYAAYHYFGGDKVFLPMLDEILEEIDQRESWSDALLVQLIQDRLGSVIIDNHFIINAYSGSTFGDPHHSFVWNTPFDRSEQGFRKRDTGLYVVDVEGHDKYELFRLSINEAGEFFYIPVIFRRAIEGSNYNLKITFEDGEQVTINLLRTVHERAHPRGARNSLHFQNGIPLVSIRRMGDSFNHYTHSHQEALQVLSYAEHLRDEPVIIVDIRSNEGGASALSYTWLYSLLGETVPTNFNWLGFFDTNIDIAPGVRRPERWYRGFSERAGLDFEYPSELFGHYLHMTPIEENILFTAEDAQDRVVSNDKLIIVLIDRLTLSSGEIFTDQFTNVENTLIIGQNTFGTLLTSSNLPLYLPNSGMPIIMGRYMLVHPEGVWQEGVGIAPDVWVVGDALTAALALLSE